jgi:general secretion pathway protein G
MRTPSKVSRIGLLVLMVGVLYSVGYRREVQREKYSRARNDISELRKNLENFRRDNARYPSTVEGLGILFNTPDIDARMVRGMSTAPDPLDPWGHPYFYQSDGESYVIGSFGPHGNGDNPDPNLPLQSN